MIAPRDQPARAGALAPGWVAERTPDSDWAYRYDPDYAAWLDGMFGAAPASPAERGPRAPNPQD